MATKKTLRKNLQEMKSAFNSQQFKYAETPINYKNLYAVARGEGIQAAFSEVVGSLDMVLVCFKGKALRKEASKLLEVFSNEVLSHLGTPLSMNATEFQIALMAENWQQQVSVYKQAYNELLAIVDPDRYEIFAYEVL